MEDEIFIEIVHFVFGKHITLTKVTQFHLVKN